METETIFRCSIGEIFRFYEAFCGDFPEILFEESLIKCSVDLFYELLYCYIVRKEEIKGHEST